MTNQDSKYLELIKEISDLKQKIHKLEKSEEEHKKTEEALRDSEQKIRALFDQAFHFIAMVSPNGMHYEINRTVMELAGVTKED